MCIENPVVEAKKTQEVKPSGSNVTFWSRFPTQSHLEYPEMNKDIISDYLKRANVK